MKKQSRNILSEIRKSKLHAVMADEVTPHNREMLSSYMWFFILKKILENEFIEFLLFELRWRINLKSKKSLLDFQYWYTRNSWILLWWWKYHCLSGRIHFKRIQNQFILIVINSIKLVYCWKWIKVAVDKMASNDLFFNYSTKREELLKQFSSKWTK